MSRDENKRVLCAFLDTISPHEIDSMTVDENTPFEESGMVDSLSMLEIVSFLEVKFGIDFSRIGIDPEHLGSVAKILHLIERSAP